MSCPADIASQPLLPEGSRQRIQLRIRRTSPIRIYLLLGLWLCPQWVDAQVNAWPGTPGLGNPVSGNPVSGNPVSGNPLRESGFGFNQPVEGSGSAAELDSGEGGGGDSGYLEQLLPSLQKLQAESAAPLTGGNDSGNSNFGNTAVNRATGTNAGAWAGASERLPGATPPVAPWPAETETRMADSRTLAPRIDSTADLTYRGSLGGEAAESGTSPNVRGSDLSLNGPRGGSKSAGAGRLAAFQGVESLQLNSTMVKVGLNTLLVLAASIALIVVVRKGLPRQQTPPNRAAGKIRVEQSLSLGGKAELKVVRCGLNQVLVAIDGGGIKSVVALEPALETEREHLEPAAESQPPTPLKEPVNIEQFVKMIKDMEGDFMSARPGR